MKEILRKCKDCGGNGCVCAFENMWAAHCMDCNNAIGIGRIGNHMDYCSISEKDAAIRWNKLNNVLNPITKFNVETYTANIYVGLMPGYNAFYDHAERRAIVKNVCQEYCNEIGLGLTLTDTEFIYTDGGEKGVIIGLINYPRFPSTEDQIKTHAQFLATKLLKLLDQNRISVVYPDKTVMYKRES